MSAFEDKALATLAKSTADTALANAATAQSAANAAQSTANAAQSTANAAVPAITYLSGPYASLPAAGTANRVYVCDDTILVLKDDGAAWRVVPPGVDLYKDVSTFGYQMPLVSAFTQLNVGSGTFLDCNGVLQINAPAAAGESHRILYQSPGTITTGTLTVALQCLWPSPAGTSFPGAGILAMQSSNGRFAAWGLSYSSATQYSLGVVLNTCTYVGVGNITYNSTPARTSWSTAQINANAVACQNKFAWIWLRMVIDATNINMQWSGNNGSGWSTALAYPRATWLTGTIDRVGIFVNPQAVDTRANFLSYKYV